MSGQAYVLRLYGDSLAMPRATAGLGFDQTYAELLRDELEQAGVAPRVFLYNRALGGQGIKRLYETFLMDSVYFGRPRRRRADPAPGDRRLRAAADTEQRQSAPFEDAA